MTCSYCGLVTEGSPDQCSGCGTFYSEEVRERVLAEVMSNTPPPRTIWKILFSLDGRISRSTFWKSYATTYGTFVLTWAFATWLWEGLAPLILITFIASRWSEVALLIKRMKDFGRSPSLLVFGVLIPVIGQFVSGAFFIEGLLREGNAGKNRFGLDPLGE